MSWAPIESERERSVVSPDLPVDAPHYASDESMTFTVGFFIKWGLVFLLLIVSVILGLVISKSATQLPDVRVLENYRPNESTRIFDRGGTLIANIHGDEDRVVVPLKEISPYMRQAVLAIEDNRFYEHTGIDLRGTLRALVADFNADDHVQGGSTVTQQLVKNLFLTPEKSYARKIAEAILAMRLERHYSKDKILEMYLNQVYFGNLSYGIEKAARRYFKVPAKRLTVAQSALLAGLLKAPEGLSPYIYPKQARQRQLDVLDKMVEFGYITDRQRRKAVEEQIVLNSRDARPSKHPYFIAYVISELEKRYGEDVVRRGGLKVYATMDEEAQEYAEKAVFNGVKNAPPGSGIKQGAMVAMDVQTGEVLAMVGGIDFQKNQFNAAVQARRAVGSTFKPFVYLTGIRLGKITPKTPISDRPIRYGNWAPHNWDGRYMGAMDIRRALTLSRNTPTVQVGMKVGVDEVIKTCKLAGIHSGIDNNSSSLLGSSGVSPLELVTAYSTLARGGIYVQPTAIKRVEDSRGNLVRIDTPAPRRVFDQDHVAALVDILIDVVEKGTGKNAILDKRVVAGKTGTTDQMRDIWFMGFTPDMVAGVWMGDPANKPMHQVFGANAAKVWHDFAAGYYEAHPIPPQQFFVASSDYAAKVGLVHLVDKSGLAEAKKNQAVENLNKKPDTTDARPALVDRYRARKAHTPSRKVVHPKPVSGGSPEDTEDLPAPLPKTVPINPALEETPSEKQQKFRSWKKTLDKLNDKLEN